MKWITPSWWFAGALLLLSPAFASAAEPELTEDLVQRRYNQGMDFARDGYGAQALREYLWCYDVGMPAFPRFKSVRTSFLIGAIKRLANDYDPAQQAMEKHCADAEKRLLGGDESAGGEFAAWCDALNDERRLLKTFDKLPAGDPRRRGFGTAAFRVLLEKRRYADALSALPYAAMARVADSQIERLINSPRASPESRENAVAGILDFIEVLAGAKETAQAQEMIAKLKVFSPTNETSRDIEKRLKRAGAASK